MNLSKTIVSKKVLFTKKETKMKKAIVMQALILIAAWFVMTPDTLEDNTYVFGLLGSYDLVRGNAIWVMIGAGVLSVLNIWFWWPSRKVASAPQTSTEDTKGVKVTEDPIVPKMD